MTFLSGSQGSLWSDIIGPNDDDPNVYTAPLAKVRSWSLSQSKQVVESTTLQDTDRLFVPGLRSYTGTASFYYFPKGNERTGLHTLIEREFRTRLPDGDGDDTTFNNTARAENPRSIGFRLYMGDNTRYATTPTSKGYYIQLRAIITELSISVGVGEITSGDMSFQVQGAIQKVKA